MVSTVLAPIPLPLVNYAVLLLATRVRQVLAHRPLEEALAALATVHTVVLATRPVAAYRTEVLGPAQRMVRWIGGRSIGVGRAHRITAAVVPILIVHSSHQRSRLQRDLIEGARRTPWISVVRRRAIPCYTAPATATSIR